MGLKAELTAQVNSSALDGLVHTFTGKLTGAITDISGISPPSTGSQLDQAGQASAAVDTGGILTMVTQVAGEMGPLVGSLPGAGDLLRPVTGALESVEEILAADVLKQIGDLVTRLGAELEPSADKDALTSLLSLFGALGDAPETRPIRDLLNRLATAVGVDVPVTATGLADLPAALASTVRMFGGLMSLESVLSEAEQLTKTMAAQLDRDALDAQTGAVVSCFSGSTSLADFLRSIDVTDPAQIEAAAAALRACNRKLWELVDSIKQGMAFGEATVVYLDVNQTQQDVAAAAALVRETDLGPLERALAAVAGKLPQLSLDPTAIGQFALDDLLTKVEAKTAELAHAIDSFDTSKLTAPVANFLARATEVPKALSDAIARVNAAVRGALDQVRAAIEKLPFDTIASAVRQVLEPIAKALEFLDSLVAAIKETLGAAVHAIEDALAKAEGAVDEFKGAVEKMFKDAADAIRKLNLDQVIGQIADNIKAFSDLIAKAQMKPYFDTAIGAINTAAGVVEKVPFSLLPDSMESDVVAALRPVKTADVAAFQGEIEDLLEIGPDGKFQLRPEVEKAVAAVQAKYDELIAEMKKVDPHKLVHQIDASMSEVAARIQAISPQIELAPLQQAIEKLRAAVGSFDLDKTLQPVRDAFNNVLKAIDEYAPGKLIAPIETRLSDARNKLLDLTHLKEVETRLDDLSKQLKSLVEQLDTTGVEERIKETLEEALDLLDKVPQLKMASGFGALIASLLARTGMRIRPLSFDVVLGWVGEGSGTAVLTTRLSNIAGAVSATRQAVEAFDPQTVSARLAPIVADVQAAVATLPAGPERDRLQALANGLDPSEELLSVVANRQRYLTVLTEAEGVLGILSRTGLSEIDTAIHRFHVTIAPLQVTAGGLRDVLTRFGLRDLSVADIARRVLSVASPARLAGMVAPVLQAVRNRLNALIDSLLAPLKDGVKQLIAVIEALDLKPLREALDKTYKAVRDQIAALHPDKLLGDVVAAFKAAQKQVADFDPLKDVLTALTDLRDTITRVLGKLKASEILASPLAIYDEITGALGKLDLQKLLAPLFDQLDAVAQQVDEGLTGTTGAFKKLQDALPDKVGQTSLTVSAEVGAG